MQTQALSPSKTKKNIKTVSSSTKKGITVTLETAIKSFNRLLSDKKAMFHAYCAHKMMSTDFATLIGRYRASLFGFLRFQFAH